MPSRSVVAGAKAHAVSIRLVFLVCVVLYFDGRFDKLVTLDGRSETVTTKAEAQLLARAGLLQEARAAVSARADTFFHGQQRRTGTKSACCRPKYCAPLRATRRSVSRQCEQSPGCCGVRVAHTNPGNRGTLCCRKRTKCSYDRPGRSVPSCCRQYASFVSGTRRACKAHRKSLAVVSDTPAGLWRSRFPSKRGIQRRRNRDQSKPTVRRRRWAGELQRRTGYHLF